MNISSCSLCKELGETCSECQPTVDMPPATGHAIPMWLRWHFDELELHATHMSGASVFTQMRTKVQAYFEMLRAVDRGNAGRELFLTGRSAEAVRGWQGMDTCPQHTEVLFYRSDVGVFSGMITDADHFLSDKERDEWVGTEQEMFDLDAFGFGDWGVCRCDGSERPSHWMPLPSEPEVKP